MVNVVYRGPVDRQPRTVNGVLAGAYLPATFVTFNGTTLTQAAAASNAAKLYLLNFNEFYYNWRDTTAPIATAFASGDTAVAFDIQPGEVYQARLAAGTYAKGDRLTIGASGRLVAVSTSPGVTDVVYAYFDDTAGTYAAGDLADVIIANSFLEPAS